MKNDKTPLDGQVEENISLARRSALMKLGLATVAVYAAPALLTLSEAEAGGRNTGKRTGKKTGKKPGREPAGRQGRPPGIPPAPTPAGGAAGRRRAAAPGARVAAAVRGEF